MSIIRRLVVKPLKRWRINYSDGSTEEIWADSCHVTSGGNRFFVFSCYEAVDSYESREEIKESWHSHNKLYLQASKVDRVECVESIEADLDELGTIVREDANLA